MLITTALFAAIMVGLVGGFILWAHPARRVNQAVFVGTLQTAAWMTCWHLAAGATPERGLFWLKWTCAIGALAPMSFWIVKESILWSEGASISGWFVRGWGWLLASAVIVVLPFTDYFIPAHSTGVNRVYGWGYYLYMVVDIGLYALLLGVALRTSRRLKGMPRLELQVWLVGGCCMFITVWTLSLLSTWTRQPIYRYMSPITVLVAYTGAAVTITAHRIFDARQIVMVALQKITLITAVAGMVYLLDTAFDLLLPRMFAFLTTVVVALWLTALLNSWLNRMFQFYPQAISARRAAFAAAGKEAQLDRLEKAFLSILKGWGQSERSLILSGEQGAFGDSALTLNENNAISKMMLRIGWATPERLAREKSSPERAALAQFLEKQELGVLVCSEGPTLKVLVGVGVAASRRPFTYPQVLQLIELAAIIENALERAHLSAKAQHAEQLATVGLLGASLAHEIRNPLVSIKTFVQLLPDHYQDQAFRDKFFKLIGDEVTRIDRLTEQLLDLASPRVYTAKLTELHPVIQTGLDLVAAKAAGKNIELRQELKAATDMAYIDPAAVKQVLLNLCFNAIQAVETQFGERWLLVATRKTPDGLEMSVSDSGPGIATEIMPRLFQPFQSTKSSGFGLGLAICRDILGSLNAVITVDQPVPGSGATFRVVFPCRLS